MLLTTALTFLAVHSFVEGQTDQINGPCPPWSAWSTNTQCYMPGQLNNAVALTCPTQTFVGRRKKRDNDDKSLDSGENLRHRGRGRYGYGIFGGGSNCRTDPFGSLTQSCGFCAISFQCRSRSPGFGCSPNQEVERLPCQDSQINPQNQLSCILPVSACVGTNIVTVVAYDPGNGRTPVQSGTNTANNNNNRNTQTGGVFRPQPVSNNYGSWSPWMPNNPYASANSGYYSLLNNANANTATQSGSASSSTTGSKKKKNKKRGGRRNRYRYKRSASSSASYETGYRTRYTGADSVPQLQCASDPTIPGGGCRCCCYPYRPVADHCVL